MINTIIYVLGAYLIGSIPVGFLVAKYSGIADIRAHGSGNIGATNVARLLGLRYFFLVFFLDACKAYGCLWLVSRYQVTPLCMLLVATFLVLGNTRSIFLQFSGGKGIATLCGIFLLWVPQLLMAGAICFACVLMATKRVGIASVAALCCLPVLSWCLHTSLYVFIFTSFASVFCIYLHRENIKQFFLL